MFCNVSAYGLSTWPVGHTWIYVLLASVVMAVGCGSAAPAAVIGKLTDHTVTATQLRERWGEPCAITKTGPNEETWTYCVVLSPETGHEEWAQCRPDCEPTHRMRIVGGIIVDDMPAEVAP